ncbi:MAG: hypothetical protein AAF483_02560 [Planctomycetota bacterium]
MRSVLPILLAFLVACSPQDSQPVFENGSFRIQGLKGITVEPGVAQFRSVKAEYILVKYSDVEMSLQAIDIDSYGHLLLFNHLDFVSKIDIGEFSEMFRSEPDHHGDASVCFVGRVEGRTASATVYGKSTDELLSRDYEALLTAIHIKPSKPNGE